MPEEGEADQECQDTGYGILQYSSKKEPLNQADSDWKGSYIFYNHIIHQLPFLQVHKAQELLTLLFIILGRRGDHGALRARLGQAQGGAGCGFPSLPLRFTFQAHNLIQSVRVVLPVLLLYLGKQGSFHWGRHTNATSLPKALPSLCRTGELRNNFHPVLQWAMLTLGTHLMQGPGCQCSLEPAGSVLHPQAHSVCHRHQGHLDLPCTGSSSFQPSMNWTQMHSFLKL